MLALWKTSRGERSFIWSLLGGLALGVGLLAGFAQIMFYEYVVLFFWMIFLVWQRRKEMSRYLRLRPILGFAAITVVGILIGGRQSLPSAVFINDTIRSSTLAMEKGVVPKPTELLTMVLPEYISLPFFGAGSPGLYAGALGLLAALFGLVFYRTEISLFFAASYGVILAIAFRLPVFGWLNDHIPPFSHMSGQFRWLVAGALPLAYLAGHGFEALVREDWPQERVRRWLNSVGWAIGLIVVVCLVGGVAVYFVQTHQALQQRIVDWRFLHHAKTFSNEYYLHILQTTLDGIAQNFSIVQWRLIVPLIILVASFFLIRRRLIVGMEKRTFLMLAMGLVAANVILIPLAKLESAYVPASVLDPEPQIVREIKTREHDPNAFRIAGFLIGDSIFWDILSGQDVRPEAIAAIYRELLINNMNVFYGIQRIDGMEPYRTLRHNQFLDTVLFPKGLSVFDASSSALVTDSLHRYVNTDVLKDVSLDEKVKDLLSHKVLLSMSNVKYVYSLIPLTDPDFKEILMEKNSFVPVPVHLYENIKVMPRIYFVQRPQFFLGKDIDLLRGLAAAKDFAGTAVIECAACQNKSKKPGSHKSSFSVVRYENGLVSLRTSTDQERWLVFGESFVPGWVATVDGAPVPMYRANYLFQAIQIPAGEHMIEFRYHDIIELKWSEFWESTGKSSSR